MTQSFDEWFELHQKEVFKNGQGCFDGGYKLGAKIAYKAGAASRQAEIDNIKQSHHGASIGHDVFIKQLKERHKAEIDELQKRIDEALSVLSDWNDQSYRDDSYQLIGEIEDILKGKQND